MAGISDSVRRLVAEGHLAHLVTLNADGSPQVSTVPTLSPRGSEGQCSPRTTGFGTPPRGRSYLKVVTRFQVRRPIPCLPRNRRGAVERISVFSSS
jgi:hypothetical protein